MDVESVNVTVLLYCPAFRASFAAIGCENWTDTASLETGAAQVSSVNGLPEMFANAGAGLAAFVARARSALASGVPVLTRRPGAAPC